MAEKRILAVEAHFDDTAWAWAGIIPLLSKIGQVDSLVFTDSNAQGIGAKRLEEQKAMMEALGMKKLYPIGIEQNFLDGKLSSLDLFKPMTQALMHVLNSAIAENFPYTQFISFGPDGYTGHPDHKITSRVVKYVFENMSGIKELWQVGMSLCEREMWGEYFVPIPEVNIKNYTPIDISQTLPQKIAAIQAHGSQMSNGGIEHINRVKQLPPVEYFKITRK